MNRDRYVRVFETLWKRAYLSDEVRRAWALDLLALGPYAQWAEMNEIQRAMNADVRERPGEFTDAARIARAVVRVGDTRTMLVYAGQLDGGNDPIRSLEVLYARSLASIYDDMKSSSDVLELVHLALAIDPKNISSMIVEESLGDDDPEYGDSFTNSIQVLTSFSRGTQPFSLDRLKYAADDVVSQLDEYYEMRLRDRLIAFLDEEIAL